MDSLQGLSTVIIQNNPSFAYDLNTIELFIDIQALYLNYYTVAIDNTSDEFFTIANKVNSDIGSIIVLGTQGSLYTLNQEIHLYSINNLVNATIMISYKKFVATELNSCSCSFCSPSQVLGMLNITYKSIFADSDGFSLQIYDAGTVTLDAENNPIAGPSFIDETELVYDGSCIRFDYPIQVYGQLANGYNCYDRPSSTTNNACDLLSIVNTTALISAYGNGLFVLRKCKDDKCVDCKDTFDVCKECQTRFFVNKTNACSNCIGGCLACPDSLTCDTCETLANGPNEDGACICSSNYGFNETGFCTACSVNNCQTCFNDFFTCDFCENGFYLNENSCTRCSGECKTCVNATFCESCTDQSLTSVNGVCSCGIQTGFNDS